MQWIRFFTVLFSLLSFYGYAQRPIPSWAEKLTLENEESVKPEQINDGYYYLLYSEQCNKIVKEYFNHIAKHIVAEAGLKGASQIEISYDPSYESVEIHFIRVTRNGVVSDRTKKAPARLLEEEKDRGIGILSKQKTIYYNLEDIQTNDIVEYAYTIKGVNPNYAGAHCSFNYLGNSEPCGRIFVKYIFPNDLPVNYKLYNTQYEPAVTKTNLSTVYEWDIKSPPVVTLEENYPVWFNPFPYVVFTSFTDWKQLKPFNYKILNGERSKNKKLDYIIDTLTNNNKGQREKQFTLLVDYVQNQIRYSGNENGIYSYTAHSPDEVVSKAYGDCKDKSLLLSELLGKIGYEAYPALVSTDYKSHVKELPPGYFWFNHCIVAVKKQNGNYIFIDPTISMQKGIAFNRFCPSYGSAMILNQDTTVFTDFEKDSYTKTDILERFTIDELTGSAKLDVFTTYYGYDADVIRYYFTNNALPEIQSNYRKYYASYSEDIKVVDTLTSMDFPVDNRFVVKEHYLLNSFWIITDSINKKIEKSFMPYSLNERISYAQTKTRNFPFDIQFPINYHQKLQIIIPGGWGVSEATKNIDNEIISYKYNTLVRGDTLILDYFYRTNKESVAPDEYTDYKASTDFIDKNMVLNSEKAIGEDYSTSVNIVYLLCTLLSFTAVGFLVHHLYKKKIQTAFETRYDNLNFWLVLIVIGLFASPLAFLVTSVKDFSENININYYKLYFADGTEPATFLQGIFELVIVFYNNVCIVFYVFLAVICLQRKNYFRKYYVNFKLFSIVFVLLNIFYLTWVKSLNYSIEIERSISAQQVALIKMIIQFSIWGSYIWFSERSRHTFTVGNEKQVEEVPEAQLI